MASSRSFAIEEHPHTAIENIPVALPGKTARAFRIRDHQRRLNARTLRPYRVGLVRCVPDLHEVTGVRVMRKPGNGRMVWRG